jgi:hypothetical protein
MPSQTVSDQDWESSQILRQKMQPVERRKYRRFAFRWRIRISGTIDSTTENLNSRGFYCILEEPLVEGDVVECELTIPSEGPTAFGGFGSLVCQAEVLRIEDRAPELGFGIAFRILDFTITKTLGRSSGST